MSCSHRADPSRLTRLTLQLASAAVIVDILGDPSGALHAFHDTGTRALAAGLTLSVPTVIAAVAFVRLLPSIQSSTVQHHLGRHVRPDES